MIHEPLISNGGGGSATSIKNISESILETKDIVNGILAKHTGHFCSDEMSLLIYNNTTFITAEEKSERG